MLLTKGIDGEDAAAKKRDQNDLTLIYQNLVEKMLEKVAATTTSIRAWEILQASFRGLERVNEEDTSRNNAR